MTHDFPYLKNSAFLKKFDQNRLKQQFVKIIVLDFNESPIQQIQGKVLSGSINIDGSSSMRRTANINMIADDYENNLTNTKHLLSINKKIELLIGFKNTTNEYQDYEMLWFPQGIYLIISANISNSLNGINIALTLHDKMVLLNGECGGVLPASIILNEVEDIDAEGNVVIKQPTLFQIIQELVNHFGKEQLGKIIISDLDNRAKQVMKWVGSVPLYYYKKEGQNDEGETENESETEETENESETEISYFFSTNYQTIQKESGTLIKQYEYGDDVGYIYTDFTYPSDLISKAGDTITSILDQIKNLLGNYEYFYDVYGNFRFQEIKNYLNTNYASLVIKDLNKDNYLVDYSGGKSVYTFDDANILTTISNSPQYQQIKNDFIVWGKRKTLTGQDIPIRYHLAIDKKPKINQLHNKVFFYTDSTDDIQKVKAVHVVSAGTLGEGEKGVYYSLENRNKIYKWDELTKTYPETDHSFSSIISTDFRTELYLQGLESEAYGLASNDYFAELKAEWPKIYDIREQEFRPEIKKSQLDYFLDFIDTSSAIGELSISNIGKRSVVISDDSINCIFEDEIPQVVILKAGSIDIDEQQSECIRRGQDYSQVQPEVYDMLTIGGTLRSAYDEIKKELYQYTSYNSQVSLTTLPIYYLEPNTRITIHDPVSGVYGDYMIKSISLPLDINGTMSMSCTEALERL